MGRLDEARERLEAAIIKLESAIEEQSARNGSDETLAALDLLRREHATLKQTTEQVSDGLDNVMNQVRDLLAENNSPTKSGNAAAGQPPASGSGS